MTRRSERTQRLGWMLVAIGLFAIVEILLVEHFNVGTTNGFGAPGVLLLAAGAATTLTGALLIRRSWTGWPSEAALSAAARACAPFLLAFAVYLTAYVVMSPVEAGDQPHYELEALSLAYDHDRDLANDYALDARVRLILPKGFDARHAYQYEPGGPSISIHHVGLPMLLTPAVPFMAALNSANPRLQMWPFHVELIALAALSAQLLYLILCLLSPARRWLRRAVWASIVFSPPLVVYANQVFPEGPATLLALVVVYALLRPPSRGWLFTGALAAAALPWLHVRFLPVAGLLAIALSYRALTALELRPWSRKTKARTAAWTLGPLVVSVIAMAAAFQLWYGSPLPDAQYKFFPSDRGLESSYRMLAQGIWSSDNGWLPYAPIFILALAALPLVVRRFGRPALFGLGVAAVYMIVVTLPAIDPAFSFPGRLTVILMPFLAIPLLLLVQDVRWSRTVFAGLALVTWALTVALVISPIPAVAGVPGQTGPIVRYALWEWFVELWPAVYSSGGSYPDAGAVAAWTAGLLALGVLVARSARGSARVPSEQVH